jgi:hypothetical protein
MHPESKLFHVISVIFLAVVISLAPFPLQASPSVTVTSTSTGGNWSAPATWIGGVVPGSMDAVIVAAGANIFVDVSSAAYSLTFTSGAANTTIAISGTNSLKIGAGGVIFNSPTLSNRVFKLDVGAGSLTVDGNVAFSASGSTRLNQLSIGAGSATISNTIAFSGFTVANQIVLSSAAAKLSTSGGLPSGGTLTMAAGSTIEFTGTSAQNISGYTFQNLRINKASGINNTTTGAVTINGNLSIDGGGLHDGGNQITGNISGTLSIASGALLQVGSNGSASQFPTNFTAANIALNTNSTVVYNSGITQTLSAVPTYGNLQIGSTNNSVKTLGGPTTIAGNLAINSGNTLATNDFALNVAGNWTNNGAFTAGNSTVTFNGVASSATLQTFTGNTTFNNLTVAAGAIVESGNSLMSTNGTYVSGGIPANGEARRAPTSARTCSTAEVDATNQATLLLNTCTGGLSNATIKSSSGGPFPNVSTGTDAAYDTCPALSALVRRYWYITPNASGVATATFSYRDSELAGTSVAPDAIKVYKCVNGSWLAQTSALTSSAVVNGYRNVVANGLSVSVGAFALGALNAPTAVRLTTLQAHVERSDTPITMLAIGVGALVGEFAVRLRRRRAK